MILKSLSFCTTLLLLVANTVSAAQALAKTAQVSGCEIAFTPGEGALNTIKTQLYYASNSVDVAMFRLSNRGLVDALCVLARDRKLPVRVILDADEITTPEDGQAYDYLRQQLVRNGVKVLIYAANDKNGRMKKMHLRAAVIDGKTVMTGSCNWRAESFKGKVDDLIVLHSPELAAIYTDEINVLARTTVPLPLAGPLQAQPDEISFPYLHTVADNDTNLPGALVINQPFKVAVYFSPDESGFDKLVKQIGAATNRLDMAMRYLGYEKMNNAVMKTASNGVPVRLAVDKDMYRQRFAPYQKVLAQPGVTTYASLPKEPGLHLKVTIIDGHQVWTGSANATVWADTLDVEDMLQIESPKVAAAYQQVFEKLANWFEKDPKNRHKNRVEKNSNSGFKYAKPKKTGTDQNTVQP